MRPSPQILLQHNISDYFQIQVAQAKEWFVVTYQDRPFQLRETQTIGKGKKYIKNGSPHYTTTNNLAERLNAMFKTSDFKATKVL